ncbi:MAG TPA: coniferyl-alcohol dehydrogenase [Novosphingobium sp.]|nr:coniferyl-alcohol dehydrogenase [Novosphingobium sp.]
MGVWSFEGKRVVIAGCFSGMGEAAARELVNLGAELHGVDIKPSPVKLASFTHVDLRDPASIDAAIASIGGEIDCLFNCSGLPQTFPAIDVLKVNYIGMRYWIEQWAPKIRKGGAIATITSTAGMGHMQRAAMLEDLIGQASFADAVAWIEARPEALADPYTFSKEAMQYWTKVASQQYIKQGVRINATAPGPTDTPMMPDFEHAVGGANIIDIYTQPINRRSTPSEQAYPLIFLNSDAASYINGHILDADGGFSAGALTGRIGTQMGGHEAT